MKTTLISFVALFWSLSTVSAHSGVGKKRAGAHRVLKNTEPQKACEDAQKDIEDEDVVCTCEDLNVNTTALSCMETCTYCNGDVSTCVSRGFEEIFDLDGLKIALADSFMYGKGRDEVVTIENTDCETNTLGILFCGSCTVSVDGEECNKCSLTVCDGGNNIGVQLPNFDCTNIEDDSIFDICDDSLVVADESVFAFLTTQGDDFDVCFPETDMPSLFPSQSPTTTPTDSTSPSGAPTAAITTTPSALPSDMPSLSPSVAPSVGATGTPTITMIPSDGPSLSPTMIPTLSPKPSAVKTDAPVMTTSEPTQDPNKTETPAPTAEGSDESSSPFRSAQLFSVLAPLVLFFL